MKKKSLEKVADCMKKSLEKVYSSAKKSLEKIVKAGYTIQYGGVL